jgi:hypothetical protein
MPVLLPLTSTKEQFTVQLGVWSLTLLVYFNDRSQLWMFDLTDARANVTLLCGAPFVLGQDLLEPYIFGIGSLVAIDTTQQHDEAGPDDLGDRVIVAYYTPEEIAAINASS